MSDRVMLTFAPDATGSREMFRWVQLSTVPQKDECVCPFTLDTQAMLSITLVVEDRSLCFDNIGPYWRVLLAVQEGYEIYEDAEWLDDFLNMLTTEMGFGYYDSLDTHPAQTLPRSP